MRLVAVLAAMMLLGGCSSSAGGKAKATPTAPKSTAFSATVGQDAAAIAGHITGCTGVASGSIGTGGPAMSSTATCTLSAHLVIIDSWTSAADATLTPGLTAAYYAHSAGWTAFLADQGATADDTTLQMQLTNDAGGLLKQGIDESALPRASLDAQRTLTAQIASALGGEVGQTTG
jgi:hypothetical protein